MLQPQQAGEMALQELLLELLYDWAPYECVHVPRKGRKGTQSLLSPTLTLPHCTAFTQRPVGISASEYPEVSLLSPTEYHFLNLLVATDNWFTSMKLALKLLELGIYLFGTCRVNKIGIPKDKVFARTGANAKKRGECQCSKTTVKVRGEDRSMYFVSRMDNKPVHFLSTIPTRASVVFRAIKEGNVYKGHNLIGIPTLVQTYNGTMGGTDRFDQQLAYYESTIKKKRCRCFKWRIGGGQRSHPL